MKKIAQFFTVVLFCTSMYSCINFPLAISGTGPVVSQTFDLTSFDEIVNETVIDVEVVQGDSQKVIAEGNENIMNFIELNVVNHKLRINMMNGSYNHFEMKVFITIPMLKEVDLESTGNVTLGEFTNLESLKLYSCSTGNIYSDGTFDIKKSLNIKSSSTGNIRISANCDEIDVQSNSTGNVTIDGNCNIQNVEMDGTGNYNGFDLLSRECTVTTNSIGSAKVNVSEVLNAQIRSIGSIYYKGDPEVNVQDSSLGRLIWSE